MQEQIIFLESLCEEITQELELPAQAIAGLRKHYFRREIYIADITILIPSP